MFELPVVTPDYYYFQEEHARGGLGKILRAVDRRLGRAVAVKQLLAHGQAATARFLREARITARLQHPSIVPIHEAGRWPNNEPFYTMKMVSGRSLKDVIAEKRTLDERLALLPNVIAVAEAVAYAHSQRVIHRDLKPSNVLVGDFGETVVVDWGLAKDLGDTAAAADADVGPNRTSPDDGLTVAGSVVGTPTYMPPEQARGEEVDQRADVYSLGALLYHVLAGAPPYQARTSAEIIQRVTAGPPIPLDERQVGVPRDLATIVTKAMARDLLSRYPSAAELAADLRRFQTGQLVTAHHYDPMALAWRWVKRHKTPVAVIGVALASVVLVGSGLRVKQAHDTNKEVRRRLGDARAVYDATLRRHEDLGNLRKHAYARFDVNGDDAERLWDEARILSGELDRDYGMASEALEAAIHRGGHNRTDVRALMADVLFERARLADEQHRPDVRDELLRRLAVYDEGGERRARWATPAHLTLTTSPTLAGVTIVLRRVDVDEKTRRRQVDETSPVASGGATLAVTLPPASYVAAIEAPGHAPVVVPLLLERAASVRLDVPLLPAGVAPRGFAYVPAGTFLFGTTDEALRQQFYYTAPLHPRTTEAFFISRTETTYADWIAFLEALPPGPERDARVPKSGTAGLQGALALEAAPGCGWRLTIQPTTTTYAVGLGDQLVYAARDRRREQDWPRLPVSGISAFDAAAYVAWLNRSGRVPGARLCTELEWERAARGADGRRFPNGDELAPDDANFQPTYGTDPATRGPDAVGAHPATRSPFGVDDMAGNVWEWVRSAAHPDEYLVRGGSYGWDAVASVSCRRELVGEPSFRDITLGLRVCATPAK